MKLVLTFMLVLSFTASAAGWFCETQASERIDDLYRVCGVGTAPTEAAARDSALGFAITEFHRLCSESDDCKNRNYSATPKRTTCKSDGFRYVCTRMIEIVVTSARDRTNVRPEEASVNASTQYRCAMTNPVIYGIGWIAHLFVSTDNAHCYH